MVFVVALGLAAPLAILPFVAGRRWAWPADPPDPRDDVARAVSSLRDLEFARAAGTIDADDYARLRGALEREAFTHRTQQRAAPAPVRTFAVAALLVAVTTVVVVATLPREAGDRAPGAPLTGDTRPLTPTTAELETRARANPRDVPAQLALADAYVQDGRERDAVPVYQAVLAIDRVNVPALNGLALILFQSGESAGARVAVERVLTLRPRDADALFLKGLILYRGEDYKGAVDVWRVYLDVGEFHPAAGMVRPLYEDAKARAGR
ncbi:MAG: tetratricopeptide repeat protein [Chloroflexota bacterium]|nr:tetratricopeptide repeat protein [Chloroflexota bacterium]